MVRAEQATTFPSTASLALKLYYVFLTQSKIYFLMGGFDVRRMSMEVRTSLHLLLIKPCLVPVEYNYQQAKCFYSACLLTFHYMCLCGPCGYLTAELFLQLLKSHVRKGHSTHKEGAVKAVVSIGIQKSLH